MDTNVMTSITVPPKSNRRGHARLHGHKAGVQSVYSRCRTLCARPEFLLQPSQRPTSLGNYLLETVDH